MGMLQKITVVLCVSVITHADPLGNFLPPELVDCVNRLTPYANATSQKSLVSDADIKQRGKSGQQTGVEIEYPVTEMPSLETPEDVHLYCIQQFMWKADMVRWEDYNITKADMDYVNSLLESLMRPTGTKHSRSKRQAGGIVPSTGFRIRREYRQISDRERNAFHAVLQQKKMSGKYDTFANYHRGIGITSVQRGPNFLGWHRVYLALFEEAMRRINRRISLPYWDSTLDFDMGNPANTILFSPAFLGNGAGFVTTGPFANWEVAPNLPLRRLINFRGFLFNKTVIQAIMTQCYTSQITTPTASSAFNLEAFHAGPHRNVGGQMDDLNTAAHDPVFFLHHAFVDFIWEMFRMHQSRVCGVNPDVDYPDAPGPHAAMRPMDVFSDKVNIDDYRSYWTRMWFRYERSPSCPFCGSPYLRCNQARGVCVSVQHMLAPDEGVPALGGFAFSSAGTAASPRAARARAQVATIDVGPRFVAPPSDPRTQSVQESMARTGMARR